MDDRAVWLLGVTGRSSSASVRRRLRGTQDVNVCDATCATALHVAAEEGDAVQVKRLLSDGADASLRDASGNTPLMIAQLHNHTAAIRYLLERDEIVRALRKQLARDPLPEEITDAMTTRSMRSFRDRVRSEASQYSRILTDDARCGDLKSVRMMVESGVVPVNAMDSETHETAFAAAITKGYWGVCEYLLTQGAHIHAPCYQDGQHQSAVLCAVRNHDVYVVQRLVFHGASLNPREVGDMTLSPLAEAARLGDTQMVDELMRLGARLQPFQCAGLPILPWHWFLSVLTPSRRACGAEDRTPWLLLAIACWYQNSRLMDHLFASLPILHDRTLMPTHGGNALCIAVYHDDQKIVADLLARGASVHEPIVGEQTALVAAVLSDSSKMLVYLLENGGDLHSIQEGESLLRIAVQDGACDCVRVLLPLESRAHVRDQTLTRATIQGSVDTVAVLLDAALPSTGKVFVTCVESTLRHNNPLLLDLVLARCCAEPRFAVLLNGLFVEACRWASTAAMIAVFLAHGADVNYVHDPWGYEENAMQRVLVSCKAGKPKILQLLLENGAEAFSRTEAGISSHSYIRSKLKYSTLQPDERAALEHIRDILAGYV